MIEEIIEIETEPEIETKFMTEDELKNLLFRSLLKISKSKQVKEWFDFEFHTIYEAGKWRGLESVYNTLKGRPDPTIWK